MKWFPDRRGLAAGLSLTAFGGGAMVGAPINEALFNYYRVRAPLSPTPSPPTPRA